MASCHFKTLLSQTSARSEIFLSRGRFVELEHFNKHFVRNTEKGSAGKKTGVFSLDAHKTIF